MKEQPPANPVVLSVYRNLMEELKARHSVIYKILSDARSRQFVLSPYFLGEMCFLQLRMMCELIALGCLLVHGDIPATRSRKMQKAYAADWIIHRLSELHPSFYPLPSVQVLDAFGKVTSIKPNPQPCLTKENLLSLYAECGTILHRGTLKSIIAEDIKRADLVRVSRWAGEITQLLNHHQIPLAGGRHQIWVIMYGKDDGKVHIAVMERIDNGQPH